MNRYMILDDEGIPVARGISRNTKNDKVWRIKLDQMPSVPLKPKADVTLVGTSADLAGLEGYIVRIEEEVVYIETTCRINEETRHNLRMLVSFDSYLYPITGSWTGRIPIVSHDLSCGGIAFYASYPLEIGELAELVLPITKNPLLLTIKILRKTEQAPGQIFYAACFVDMINDQESLVREAVFNIQIDRKKKR